MSKPDKEEIENWKKIKDHFEEIGMTENMYYKRALAICSGEPDPMADKLK